MKMKGAAKGGRLKGVMDGEDHLVGVTAVDVESGVSGSSPVDSDASTTSASDASSEELTIGLLGDQTRFREVEDRLVFVESF